MTFSFFFPGKMERASRIKLKRGGEGWGGFLQNLITWQCYGTCDLSKYLSAKHDDKRFSFNT